MSETHPDYVSTLPAYTPRQIVLRSLFGVVMSEGHIIKAVGEDSFLKRMASEGVSRDDALPLVHALMGDGMIERDWPGELSGEPVQWRLTLAGLEEKESIRRQRYQAALRLLGPIEQRHEHVIRAADRSEHSKVVAEAWATLGEPWDIVQTVKELARAGMISDHAIYYFSRFNNGPLGLTCLGMDLVRDRGWSRYRQAG